MFKGSTPNEVKILLQDLMKDTAHNKKDVFIGCSGNFTVDKIMSKLGYNVHSNDVCLYSKLIADVMLGTDTELEVINPELKVLFDSWQDSKYKKLIQIMFTIRLSDYAPLKNDYQRMFFDSWMCQSEQYYTKTIEKFEKGAFDFNIKSFEFCDFVDFLKAKNGKGVGISFQPTYKAGYEKMFDYVEKAFNYERAEYKMFDPKEGSLIFQELLEADENIIYSDREWPELMKWESGVVNLGAGKQPLFLYSSIAGEKYYFQRDKKQVQSTLTVLPANYEFTKRTVITVGLCSVNDINYFKAFYMANKVNYTTGGDMGLAFFADGKAFGFTSFSKMLSTMELIFMQSDFVANTDTGKLSKLLIMLTRSTEVRKVIARKIANYYEGLKTTVYTESAISMKYRGVYELERRDKGKLMYVGKFTNQTLKQIYSLWLDKNYRKK